MLDYMDCLKCYDVAKLLEKLQIIEKTDLLKFDGSVSWALKVNLYMEDEDE